MCYRGFDVAKILKRYKKIGGFSNRWKSQLEISINMILCHVISSKLYHLDHIMTTAAIDIHAAGAAFMAVRIPDANRRKFVHAIVERQGKPCAHNEIDQKRYYGKCFLHAL